jgi:hypothetical protein
MSELVDASTWQYAVITIRTQPRRERMVIAYPDEKTLRTFIAAPSIVALGYDSRDQAAADIDRCVPTTVGSRPGPGAELVGTNRKSPEEICAAKRRFARRSGLTRTRNVMRHILQHGVAAAIVFVCSSNVLSATVRAFATL